MKISKCFFICFFTVFFAEIAFGGSFQKDFKLWKKSFIKNIKTLVKNDTLDEKLLEFDLRRLSDSLDPDRDLKFKFQGISNLYDRYLIKIDGHTYESPQAFWMRVSMGLAIDEENKEISRILSLLVKSS